MFLCQISQELNSGRQIILLDDPISSYDAYRRFNLISDLDEVLNTPSDKEIIILTHEKSFTNSARFISSMNFFTLKDGAFHKVDPKSIVESDLKDDVEYIRGHSVLNNDESLIEFLVRSRNIIEYARMKVNTLGTKNFNEKRYNKEYSNISSVIHMRSVNLESSYLKYLQNVFYRLVRNKLSIDCSNINIANIDIQSLLPTSTTNPYINRVILDDYFQTLLLSAGETVSFTATTGELLDQSIPYLQNDKVRKTKLILPLLNIFNHPNLNYGIRKIDIDDNKHVFISKLVNEVIT